MQSSIPLPRLSCVRSLTISWLLGRTGSWALHRRDEDVRQCTGQRRRSLLPRPPRSHLAGRPHLLVTLLLRYGLGNQPGLTCEHVAIQVERRQVTACEQKPRGDRTESSLTVPECSRVLAFLGRRREGVCAEPAQPRAASPVLLALCSSSPTRTHLLGNTGRWRHQGPGRQRAPSHPRPQPLACTVGNDPTAADMARVSDPGSSLPPHQAHRGGLETVYRNSITGTRAAGPSKPCPGPLNASTVGKQTPTH